MPLPVTKTRTVETNVDLLRERFYLDASSVSGLRMKVGSRKSTHNPRLIRNPGDVAGSKNQEGYWTVNVVDNISLKVHRIIWILSFGIIPEGLRVDHKDGNGFNNDLLNLQLLTNPQNVRALNSPYECNTSGYLGVFKRPNNSWQAMMRRFGKLHYLGTFSNPKSAARAYNEAVIAWAEEHGETPRYLNPV
jgi:hypothetical protein